MISFLIGRYASPSMSYVSTKYSIIVSSSAAKTYAFKNAGVYFKENLTNAGVKFYRDIDNQNNKEIFTYINPQIGKKVE